MHVEANIMALALEKKKGFIVKLTSKETGSKTHTCVPDLGVWRSSKGFEGNWTACGSAGGAVFYWRYLELGHLW